MNPIQFPMADTELQKPPNMTDEECGPLPICHTTDGSCVSCWKGTWKERLTFLFTGVVWLGVLSGQTQPPVWVTAIDPQLKRE